MKNHNRITYGLGTLGRDMVYTLISMYLMFYLTVILFADFGLPDGAFIPVFGITYIAWGISYTMHDISYWSMLPTLSQDLRMREKIGSVARICASIGLLRWYLWWYPLPLCWGRQQAPCRRDTFSLPS